MVVCFFGIGGNVVHHCSNILSINPIIACYILISKNSHQIDPVTFLRTNLNQVFYAKYNYMFIPGSQD